MYLKSYKELFVWQKSVEVVVAVYKLTAQFSREDLYGLAAQMKRAAVSVPSNIAEGSRRKDVPEYLQFLRTADASSAELETQVVIAKRIYPNLNYKEVDGLLEEVQKMLNGMMIKLEAKSK